MIFLIGQLAGWLLLTAAFAALAGWAFAAQGAAAGDAATQRDRDHLIRDLVALANGGSGAANDSIGAEREIDAVRRMGEIQIARIAELERALSAARANADSAAAQAAELQRLLEARDQQAINAQYAEPEPSAEAKADAQAEQEAVALQAWRLRYFEQRVRYLETNGQQAAIAAPAPVAASAPAAGPPLEAWRARVAQAEAAYLAEALRAERAPSPETEAETLEPGPDDDMAPFAANADVDMLLRWRMLYLERRVAYLQAQAAAEHAPESEPGPEPEPEPEAARPLADSAAGPDPDRWKWRARYLEARARHLEQRLADAAAQAAPAAAPAQVEQPPPEPAREVRRAKPETRASARNGAPDDFTLIDGVSLLQQTTLYSLGIFHFDQIAAWTPENVAWVDHYLRLRGRIDEEEWVQQAADLAREGPAAARRAYEEEDA